MSKPLEANSVATPSSQASSCEAEPSQPLSAHSPLAQHSRAAQCEPPPIRCKSGWQGGPGKRKKDSLPCVASVPDEKVHEDRRQEMKMSTGPMSKVPAARWT
eukprot:CAMPEP_0180421480 /NCGR_PEP_ID=MMETSP1036_2-20121128/3176_1 /TAXON_ID=632150 /ORGANISM="Azadinium spinosum, Strain 3D9" /LENGTH=101 /DNA_ID=CAMNT_0022426753 /DNA_START=318 /DNA_END=621 /DNA_ORIENTATION=+